MDGISTITQKGQVAIPKSIRDYFDLKPSDKIVAKKILNIDDMLGVIPFKASISKQETKALIKAKVLKKYASRS